MMRGQAGTTDRAIAWRALRAALLASTALVGVAVSPAAGQVGTVTAGSEAQLLTRIDEVNAGTANRINLSAPITLATPKAIASGRTLSINPLSNSFTIDAALSGAGNLELVGGPAPATTISAVQAFSGNAAFVDRSVTLTIDDALASASGVTLTSFQSMPTFTLTNTAQRFNRLTGTGNVVLGASGALTIVAPISGDTLEGAVTGGSGSRLTIQGNNNFSLRSNLAGFAGTLAVGGAGVTSLSIATTSAVLEVASGATAFVLGATTVTGLSGAGTVEVTNGRLTVNNAADYAFTGPITGSVFSSGDYLLVKSGAGALTLSAPLSFTSGDARIQITGGTLRMGAAGVLNNTVAGIILDGGTLDLNGFANPINRVTSAAGTVIDGGAAQIDLGNSGFGTVGTVSGTLQGSGGLRVRGSLTVGSTGLLAYTGDTTLVNNFTFGSMLTLTADNQLPANTRVVFAGGGNNNSTLVIGGTTQTINSLAGGGTVSFDGSGTGRLIVGGDNADATSPAFFFGTGTLEKVGTGTHFIASAGGTAGAAIVTGGTLRVLSAGAVTVGAAGTLIAGSSDGSGAFATTTTIRSLSGSGAVRIGAGVLFSPQSARLEVGSGGASSTFAGAISGPGGLTKAGTGTLTLTGVNTYTGPTGVSGGRLVFANAAAVPAGGGLSIGAGATLDVSAAPATFGTVNLTGTIDNGAQAVTLGDGFINPGATIAGTGALVKSGAGQLVNYADLVLPGGLTVAGGTFQIGFPGVNGLFGSLTGDVRLDGGALAFARSDVNALTGNISGTGGVTQRGGAAAVTTLSGTNTYTGPTTVEDGTLRAGSATAFGTNSAVTVGVNAILDLAGQSVAIGGLSGQGEVELGAGTLTLGGGDASGVFRGGIDGTGGLTKVGAGEQRLTSVNNYTGLTTVTGGSLLVTGPDGRLAGDVLVGAGGLFGGTGRVNGTVTVNGRLSPGLSPGTLFIGALTLNPGSTTTFELADPAVVGSNVNDFIFISTTAGPGATGNLTTNGGTVNVVGLAGFTAGTYRLIEYNGAFAGPISNLTIGAMPGGFSGTLQQIAGQVNLVVAAAATVPFWNGPNTVPLGTVAGGSGTWDNATTNWTNAAGAAVGSWDTNAAIFAGTAGTVTLGANIAYQSLEFRTSGYRIAAPAGLSLVPTGLAPVNTLLGVTATIEAPITGAGGLDKRGDGTLVLAGANTYTGGTQINGGVLAVGAPGGPTGVLPGTVAINAGTLRFQRGDTLVHAGAIIGAGRLEQAGPGTLVLTGDAAHTGGTTITAGTLQIGNGGIAGSLAGDVVNDGALVFARADDIAFAGAISGAGTLTQAGPGTLTLAGANTHAGGTSVLAGRLAVASDATLGTGGLTLAGGTLAALADLAIARPVAVTAASAIEGGGRAVVLGGPLAGNGPLALTNGAFVLQGGGTYAGTIDLVGSRLAVDSILTGANVTVGSGSVLGGTGVLGGLAVADGGVLAPGNSIGTLTTIGGATFAPNSVFAVEIDGTGASDRLVVVGGAAALAGTVAVLPLGAVAAGQSFTILTAGGGVTGTFSGASLGLTFLRPVLAYGPTSVTLTLEQNAVTLGSVAQTPNQFAVASVLDPVRNLLGPNAPGGAPGAALTPAGRILLDRLNLLDPSGARAALADLAGEGHASGQAALLAAGGLVTGMAADQAAFWRRGGGLDRSGFTLSDPLAPRSWRAWAGGLGAKGTLAGEAARGTTGLAHTSLGVAVGLDYEVTPNLLLGASLGGTSTRFELRGGRMSGTAEAGHASLYGVLRGTNAYLTGLVGGTLAHVETERRVTSLGPSERLEASHLDQVLTARVEAGWRQPFGAVGVTPFAAFEHRTLRQGAFRERAEGGGILGLDVRSGSSHLPQASLGLEIDGRFELPGMTVTPRVRAAWVRSLEEERSIRASFVALPGVDLETSGVRSPRDLLSVQAGLDVATSRSTTLFANLTGEFAERWRSYGVMGGLRILLDDRPVGFSRGMPTAGLGSAARAEYESLFRTLVVQPSNLDLGFRFAEIATEVGDYEAAIGALERLLFYNPNLPRVRLELGFLYFRLGSFETARTYFEEVLRSDVPASVRERVTGFLDEIARRQAPKSFSVFAQTGLRWQSNANAGPDGTLVRALGNDAILDRRFAGRGDTNAFATVVARHIHDFGNQRGDAWETTVSAHATRQFEFSRFNLGYAEIQTGPRLALAPDALPNVTVYPYLVGNAVTLGDAQYLGTVGAGAALTWRLGSQLTLEPSVEVRRREFSDTRDFPRAEGQSGTLATAALLASGDIVGPLRWQARVAYAVNDAKEGALGYRQVSADLRLPFDFRVPAVSGATLWTLAPSVGFQQVRYDAPDALVDADIRRQDTEWRAALTLDAAFTARIGFSAQVFWSSTRSSLPNFDTSNVGVSAGPTIRF